jgi:hypothetical protein
MSSNYGCWVSLSLQGSVMAQLGLACQGQLKERGTAIETKAKLSPLHCTLPNLQYNISTVMPTSLEEVQLRFPSKSEADKSSNNSSLCPYCTELVQAETSGFLHHYTQAVELQNSAESCEFCRLLYSSLEGDVEDRMSHHFSLVDRIRADVTDSAAVDGTSRTVHRGI